MVELKKMIVGLLVTMVAIVALNSCNNDYVDTPVVKENRLGE